MNLILLSGKTCSGKSTLAEGLVELDPRYRIVSLADELKADVASFRRISVQELEADKGKYRDEMQYYGVAMRRDCGPGYWIDRMVGPIKAWGYQHIIVPDVRFPNELRELARLGNKSTLGMAITVRLGISVSTQAERYMSKYGVPLSDEARCHSSERGLDKYHYFDVFLDGALPTVSQVEIFREYARNRGFDFLSEEQTIDADAAASAS